VIATGKNHRAFKDCRWNDEEDNEDEASNAGKQSIGKIFCGVADEDNIGANNDNSRKVPDNIQKIVKNEEEIRIITE
jgi:hypothetical protein